MDTLPVRRALLSVFDKTGLVDLARALVGHGATLLSSGGTAAALRAAGIAVQDVAEVSGFPEILDGRVKTLVPQVHAGLLARRDVAADLDALAAHGIAPIDLVVANLYPFEAAVASGADRATCIERIDVGGPAMIRAAAKNHADVAVLTDPAQYAAFAAALSVGGTTPTQRRDLAGAAFARVAAYDAAIATWFAAEAGAMLPDRLIVAGTLRERLRYGENPHQEAALYATADPRPGVLTAHQVQGKALSYNNLADTDAALDCVAEFAEPAVVIVKHANPCGAATAATPLAAWLAALGADPVSAFGGVVALNRPLDAATAEAIGTIFTEVIVAPGATEAARAALTGRKYLRLLLTDALPDPSRAGLVVRSIAGGLLAQTRDAAPADSEPLRIATLRAPSEAERAGLLFAWRVCKHVRSNAIVLARDGATIGIGAGQMSRLDAARIAVRKAQEAGHTLAGAVAASDAFFPFPDGLQVLADAGVTAVIQPGGSIRDDVVVATADAAGMTMLLTGTRHFRH